MAKTLTVKWIERLKPTGKREEFADQDARGLYLIMQPSGVISWAFRYRVRTTGQTRKHTIGRWPDVTLSDARTEAMDLAGRVRKGGDPAKEMQVAKERARDKSDLIGTLLDDFIEKYIKVNNAPSTIKTRISAIDHDVRPPWGNRKAETITKRDVVVLLGEIVKRGAPTQANRTFALIRKFFNWLVDEDVLQGSPCAGMKKPSPEAGRARVLTDDEIRWLWKATAPLENFDRCVRVLLLSVQRRLEIGGMFRSEVFVAGESVPHILLPPERTKNGLEHMAPLTSTALDLLGKVPKVMTEEGESDLVFTTNGYRPSSGWSKSKRALDERMLSAARKEALEAGDDPDAIVIPRWTLHDLRRTASTGMAKLKQPPYVVEAVLNHISGEVSGVAKIYNRYQYLAEKYEALQHWERHLLAIVEEGTHSNVVAFAR